jgi:hypothetical protein
MIMWTMLLLAEVAVAPPSLPTFLAGCWEQRQADRWTEECWTGPRGGLMIGSGRDGVGDTVRHWEWMRIERGTDGAVSFYGSPKGAAPVTFRLTHSSADEAVFVNPSHDYPQRIRYRRTTTGIDAEISLADGSRPNRWTYRPMGAPPAR